MKDYRDLISIIEEGQYAFDDSHPYFDGVWDAFKRIETLSVPDAVAAPPPAMQKQQMRRFRAMSSNVKPIMDRKSDDSWQNNKDDD